MDLEKSFFSRIVIHGGFSQALDAGVSDVLLEGRGKEIWTWLKSHYREHGAPAGTEAFRREFPDYVLDDTANEAVTYYIEQFRRRFAYNELSDGVRKTLEILKSRDDPFAAVDILRHKLRGIDSTAATTSDIDWTKTLEERFNRYLEIKKFKGIDGIPTGFQGLDTALMGFHPEEYHLVCSRPKVGKSWLCSLLAVRTHNAGFRPILFTKEMGTFPIARRVDAMKFKLPYGQLRAGGLDTSQELAWQEAMANEAEKQPLMVIGEAGGGVSLIAAKIDQYKPDIVFIDGVYFLKDDRDGEADWLRHQHISEDLKQLSKSSHTPIVATTQLNKEGEIAYADILRHPDSVIILEADEDMKMDKELRVILRAHREGATGEWLWRWDLDTMEFFELNTARTAVQEVPQDDPLKF